MIGREHYFFDELKDMDEKDILSGFIKQYYYDNPNIPNKIMLREEIDDKLAVEKWLEEKAGKKVELKNPQKGEKLKFVEMAELNSKITLENRVKDKTEILTEFVDVLGLEKLPRKIESFDISNISGSFIVAGMCVAIDGKINRSKSRRFKIKNTIGQDDPKCMQEVVTRRLKHSLIEPSNTGFGTLPDLILADGGITQIRAIKNAVNYYNLNIPVYGMVKDDNHRTRALIDEDRKEYEISEKLMNFITNFQDEVHKTAIEYHRKVRDKEITKSALDGINGIGTAKKKELLKKFGSVKKIKEATIEELTEVKGINEKLAREIKENL